MSNRKEFGGIDYFRVVAAILVVAVHISPLLNISSQLDFLLTRILARIAVPFFFMISGYFVVSKKSYQISSRACKKLLFYYTIAILIYIPINIYAGQLEGVTIFSIARMIIFDGTFYHLWYFPASIIGIMLTTWLLKNHSIVTVFIITVGLYIMGLLGDSYFGFAQATPVIKEIMNFLFIFFDYTRNGIFMAPIFLILGVAVRECKFKLNKSISLIGFIIMLICMVIEAIYIHELNWVKHDSMYIFLIPCMFFLYNYLIQLRCRDRIDLRNVILWIYIIHPIVIIAIRGFSKLTNLTSMFVDNHLILFVTTFLCSLLVAVLITFISKKKENCNLKRRAWIEISKKALSNNIMEFKKRIPESCKIMAILKADAYGHGDILIGKYLNQLKITNFGVATIDEGIALRKNKVKGEILILGYTDIDDLMLIKKYNLTQTLVSYEYASLVNQRNLNIKCHLAIDTGMHRLGINYEDKELLYKIGQFKNIKLTGVFSHLCVADEKKEESRIYTNLQLKRFENCMNSFGKKNHIEAHILSSYGVLNYPQGAYDMIRLGLGMFGVYSTTQDINEQDNLMPVLSIKSKIVLIRELNPNEKLGYGLQYTTKDYTKIAVVAGGYGDGLPRELSCKGRVLIKGEYCPIVGRICMDQFMVDISSLSNIHVGEIVTIVGENHEKVIRVEELANHANSISNEILCQLKSRLPRILVE